MVVGSSPESLYGSMLLGDIGPSICHVAAGADECWNGPSPLANGYARRLVMITDKPNLPSVQLHLFGIR